MQGVRGREHLPAPAHQEPMQEMWGREHLPAPAPAPMTTRSCGPWQSGLPTDDSLSLRGFRIGHVSLSLDDLAKTVCGGWRRKSKYKC